MLQLEDALGADGLLDRRHHQRLILRGNVFLKPSAAWFLRVGDEFPALQPPHLAPVAASHTRTRYPCESAVAFQSDKHLKSKLQDVFVDWLIQRFIDMGKTEVVQMLLGKLPDLRDTQTGKDLIAIGVEEGMNKGIEIGKIQILEQILGLPETDGS